MRVARVVLVVSFITSHAPAHAAEPAAVVVDGMGAAHGFGLAMDGVLGQAKAGWTHTKILDLFYPGTVTGRAGGVIRVGLGVADTQRITLPGGGIVSDAPQGVAGEIDTEVAPGTTVSVSLEGDRVTIDGFAAASSEVPPPAAASEEDPPEEEPPAPPPLPSSPPEELPLEPEEPQEPTPEPAPEVPLEPPPTPPSTTGSVWIVPFGDPALSAVEVTGRRYRGVMEVRRNAAGDLVAVNHVDLDTYVMGIAEEKGQGWPIEGLKTLAIAARSLGAATMGWYGRNHVNGFDICPTDMCQVYLGYDGEEPAMRRATAETAGQIRTHKGTPILAMYHGNGGGQTETYARVAGVAADVHPYLRSVRYPHANPRRWQRETSMTDIAAALGASQEVRASVPTPLERIEVIERGESPRVLRVRLVGGGRSQELPGTAFARALDLPSTWFAFPERSEATVAVAGVSVPRGDLAEGTPTPAGDGRTLAMATFFALVAVAGAGSFRAGFLSGRDGKLHVRLR